MNKIMVWAAAAALTLAAAGSGKLNAGEAPLVRIHFAGAGAWQKQPAAARLAKLEGQTATREWEAQIAHKFGLFAPQIFNFGTQTNLAATLAPLATDWWQNGGFIEINGQGARRQTVIAATLPETRRAAWKQAADQIKPQAGNRLAFAQAGAWTIVACGDNAAAVLSQFQQQVKAGKAPALTGDNWLQARLNLPALAPMLGLSPTVEWPVADLEFSSKSDDVRVNGSLDCARPVTWKPEAWQIPRATINDPLVSFTAANGVAPWLGQMKWFQDLKLKSAPNQVFGWSMGGMPLLIHAAVPVNNSTGMVTELSTKLPQAALNWIGQQKMGDFLWISNRAEVLWHGLPIISPHLKAVKEPAGEFLVAQLFPTSPKATNPPPELFAQVTSKPNLVYYSWEITESRISSWRQVFQLLPLFSSVPQVPVDFAGQKWLQASASQLGNTVTEITYVSPQKMSFTRRGHLGLTGVELTLLARQLDLWGQPPGFGVLKRPTPPSQPAKK